VKCAICDKQIGIAELRTYVRLWKGTTSRKVYACGDCQEAFDRLIDALPVDNGGCPIDVGQIEQEALKLATDRKRLEKRLRAARSVMSLHVRRNFGRGRLDFLQRQLIGDNGMVLQWRTRRESDKPVSHLNQQTTVGIVSYSSEPLHNCEN